MRIDFEERIVLNPMLGAVLLWNFVAKYQERDMSPPDLVTMMPVLPIALHQASVARLKGMWFDSGLTKALVEFPMMRAGLRERISSLASLTLSVTLR